LTMLSRQSCHGTYQTNSAKGNNVVVMHGQFSLNSDHPSVQLMCAVQHTFLSIYWCVAGIVQQTTPRKSYAVVPSSTKREAETPLPAAKPKVRNMIAPLSPCEASLGKSK
jgi:hypothetical protein